MPTIIEELKKLSNRDLKKRAKSLYEVIYQGECYGVNDMLEYELVIKELNLRGFEVNENSNITIDRKAYIWGDGLWPKFINVRSAINPLKPN